MRRPRRHRNLEHHGRVPSFLAIAALTLTLGATGCDSAEQRATADAGSNSPISNANYGTRSGDLGPSRELNRLANLYATLQRRFRAGDFEGVCHRVSPFLLEQFPPDNDLDGASCEKRVAAYRRQIGSRPPTRLRIDWLRVYHDLNMGGITATDERGRRLRLSFHDEGGKWMLRLGVLARPDTLNGTLSR